MSQKKTSILPSKDPAQEFLTAQEVCVRLRLPLSTVYHLAKTDVLPAIQLGRTWRFYAQDIAALAERKPAAARVLVVDDDAVTRALVLEVLESQGHVLEAASDAATGLAAARGQRFDLLLIDFKLPGKDGTELIRELRSEYSLSQMVMITAFAGLMEMDKLFGLGALTVLRKPLDANQLIECVERMLTQGGKKFGSTEKVARPNHGQPAINAQMEIQLHSKKNTADVLKPSKS